MSFLVGVCGKPNTGKSYSRKFIPDGENVFIIAPSPKALYLKDSKGGIVKKLNVSGKSFKNFAEARVALGLNQTCKESTVLKRLVQLADAGQISPADVIKNKYFTGNAIVVNELTEVDTVLKFLSVFMPHIHTVIIPDFSHFVSFRIAQQEFIERKAGGEAYQRFWELAGDAMRNFLLNGNNYNEEMIIVTEYHAEEAPMTGVVELFVPAGKMLTEKFKVESYYDFLFFTDALIETDPVSKTVTKKEFRFVTEATSQYPQARSMGAFDSTFIPNNLFEALKAVRESIGMHIPKAWETPTPATENVN